MLNTRIGPFGYLLPVFCLAGTFLITQPNQYDRVRMGDNAAIEVESSFVTTFVAITEDRLEALSEDLRVDEERIGLQIDAQVDQAFAPAYRGIDGYLDFHYSVVGQYLELGAAAFPSTFGSEIEDRLIARTGIVPAIRNIELSVYGEHQDAILATIVASRSRLGDELALTPSEFRSVSALLDISVNDARERFGQTVSLRVSAGVALAVRGGARQVAQRAAPRLFRNIALRRIGGGLVGAFVGGKSCALGGPLAAGACAVVGGGAIWLGTDQLAVIWDERWNRDDMHAQIRGILDAEKQRIKDELRSHVEQIIEQSLEAEETFYTDFRVIDLVYRPTS